MSVSSESERLGWGDPDSASTLVRRGIHIVSAADLAWDLQVRVGEWPSWQPDITDAWLSERLGPDALFGWVAEGRILTARVDEYREGASLSWSATDDTISLIQEWTFAPSPHGVFVTASELRWNKWPGDDADGGSFPSDASRAADAALAAIAAEASVATWLANLKAEAEART